MLNPLSIIAKWRAHRRAAERDRMLARLDAERARRWSEYRARRAALAHFPLDEAAWSDAMRAMAATREVRETIGAMQAARRARRNPLPGEREECDFGALAGDAYTAADAMLAAREE